MQFPRLATWKLWAWISYVSYNVIGSQHICTLIQRAPGLPATSNRGARSFTSLSPEWNTLCSKLKIAHAALSDWGTEQTQVWSLNHQRRCPRQLHKATLVPGSLTGKARSEPSFELRRALGLFAAGAKRDLLKVWKWKVPHQSCISTPELFSCHWLPLDSCGPLWDSACVCVVPFSGSLSLYYFQRSFSDGVGILVRNKGQLLSQLSFSLRFRGQQQ